LKVPFQANKFGLLGDVIIIYTTTKRAQTRRGCVGVEREKALKNVLNQQLLVSCAIGNCCFLTKINFIHWNVL
jgi:hypothetical protein